MLRWALIFFIVAIVAAIFGFTGISEAAADVAKFLFYLFVVLFLVALIAGIVLGRKISSQSTTVHLRWRFISQSLCLARL